jgi:hypothetical protein
MAVTKVRLEADIQGAIVPTLRALVAANRSVGADPSLDLRIDDFGKVLASAIAAAIVKAHNEGVVG